MNNPLFEESDRMTNVAYYQLHLAKGSWLAAINIQGNLNEYSIDPSAAGYSTITTGTGTATTTSKILNQSFYPKYNFGLSLPLDIFSRIPANVKIARENYLIAQANKNERFREIKALVLTSYEDYLLSWQKLQIQTSITSDAYTNYQLAEDDFRKNVIKSDDYNKAYRNWIAEKLTQLELQRNLNVTKIELERYTGVSLDEILKENQ
jgi:outer membrane protein TolC